MATNGIVNSLSFLGTFAGQATIQAQPIGGNLIFQLPNQLPSANQLMAVESVSGSVVTLGFAAPQSSPSFSSITGQLALAQIAQGGATTNQVLEWNGTAWTPTSSPPLLYTATGSAPLTANNHIASGLGTFPGTGGNTVTISLSGAAQFSSGATYVVQITLTSDPTAFLPFSVWVDTQTANSFVVHSTSATDTSGFVWTAIGL